MGFKYHPQQLQLPHFFSKLISTLMSLCRQTIRKIPIISLLHSSYSSSAKKTNNNYYLRKKRKCPFSQYTTQYQETFTHQLAMQQLKNSIKNSPKSNLLSLLIDSFALYQCSPTPNSYFFILKLLTKNPSTDTPVHKASHEGPQPEGCTKNPSIWDQIHQILDHVNKVENFEIKEYFFSYLIKFYGDFKQPHLGYELFFSMPSFGINPSVKSLNCLLVAIFKNCCDFRLVVLVMVKCQSLNLWVEESTFKILIRELCRIGKGKNGFNLLCLMVDSGFDLDGNICSLILSTICEDKECEVAIFEIWAIFAKMREFGFWPKRVDLCNVIRFCVKNGKGVDALEVLNKLKLSGMDLDIVCYNLVLNGLVLEGEYEKVDEVFDELLVLGLVPNIVTYNVYINGLCKQNKLDEAVRMIGCMEDLGCKPEMNTFYTVLDGLCRSGMVSNAKDVFVQMKSKGLLLNSQVYDILVNCMVRCGAVEEACNMLHEMVDSGFVPNSITFDGLMHVLCQRGLFSEAVELLSQMVAKNVVPGVRSWEVLVQGVSQTQNLDEFI